MAFLNHQHKKTKIGSWSFDGAISGNLGMILKNRNFGKQEKRHTGKKKLHLVGLHSQIEK